MEAAGFAAEDHDAGIPAGTTAIADAQGRARQGRPGAQTHPSRRTGQGTGRAGEAGPGLRRFGRCARSWPRLNRDMQDNIRISRQPGAGRAVPQEDRHLEKDIENLQAKNSDEDSQGAAREGSAEAQQHHRRSGQTDRSCGRKRMRISKRKMTAAMTAFDEVRVRSCTTCGSGKKATRTTGLAKELTLKTAGRRTERQLETSKSTPSRVEFKEHAQVPAARQTGSKLKFAGGAGAGHVRPGAAAACSCSSSRSGAFTRSTTWPAASACVWSARCRTSGLRGGPTDGGAIRHARIVRRAADRAAASGPQRRRARRDGDQCRQRRGQDVAGVPAGREPRPCRTADAADRRRPAQSGGAYAVQSCR